MTGTSTLFARACPVRTFVRERVHVMRERVRVIRERVRPHVPIGALGVAVIWLGLSQHMPVSTLPGASLLATAICLMRRCGYIHQRTLSRAMAAGRSRMRRAVKDGRAWARGFMTSQVAVLVMTPGPSSARLKKSPQADIVRRTIITDDRKRSASRWTPGESRAVEAKAQRLRGYIEEAVDAAWNHEVRRGHLGGEGLSSYSPQV